MRAPRVEFFERLTPSLHLARKRQDLALKNSASFPVQGLHLYCELLIALLQQSQEVWPDIRQSVTQGRYKVSHTVRNNFSRNCGGMACSKSLALVPECGDISGRYGISRVRVRF
jgi:hypothetical protein